MNPSDVANCIDNLYITQVALVRYVQEELSGLVVSSQFDGTTKTVFKAMQKYTSVYTPEVIDSLKTAVSLTQNSIQTYHNQNHHHQPRGFMRGQFRPRGQSQQEVFMDTELTKLLFTGVIRKVDFQPHAVF